MKEVIALIGILSILTLALVALCKGINGLILAGAMSLIAGVSGYATGRWIIRPSDKK